MDEENYINAINGLRRFIQKEILESNNNIRIDALYQQLLLEHVFKRPEPLAAMTGWSIAPEFAWWLYQHVITKRPQKLIELGSGTSTIVIATALKKNGVGKFLSFEHEHEYYVKTKELLELCDLVDYVELVYSPLEVYEIDNEKYRWYSLPYDMIDHMIGYNELDFLLIDGPPAATNRHARYPSFVQLRKYCKDSTTILLDDASRQEEKEILEKWQELSAENYEYNLLNNIRHGPALFYPRDAHNVNNSHQQRIEKLNDTYFHELFKMDFFREFPEEYLNDAKEQLLEVFYKYRERSNEKLKLKIASNERHHLLLQTQLIKINEKLKSLEGDRNLLFLEIKELVKKQKLIYKSLTYQLGLALYRHSRSLKLFLKMPFALRRVLRRHSVNGAPDIVEFKSNEILPAVQLKLAKTGNVGGQPSAIADICKRIVTRKRNALCRTILWTSSLQGREILIYLASDGKLSMPEFLRALEACRNPIFVEQASEIIRNLKKPWVIQLAEVMASQRFHADDELNAFTLLWCILNTSDASDNMTELQTEALASLSIVLLKYDKLKSILPYVKKKRLKGKLIHIDSKNPIFGGNGVEWLKSINDIFSLYELEPISFSKQGENVFSRIECVPKEVIDNDVLVTVIITAWCPDEGLLQAVKSILQQSWRNLEVIIVDDASPYEYLPLFDKCKALDKRVKVIHQSVNLGTYVARNEGLKVASGTYVTFQDSDDWSHPRRIELQLQELESNPKLVVCYSYCFSVSEQLIFSRPYRASFTRNTSSMMFRRVPVIEKVGFMDSVRKGADTEYGLRINIVFGADSSSEIKKPLAFIRLASGSLSRDEFKNGWQHPARIAYKNMYSYWHSLIQAGKDKAYLASDLQKRRFKAPLRFLANKEEPYQRTYDVVFVGDWYSYGGSQKSMIEEIKALHNKDMKLAICSMDAYRFLRSGVNPLCEEITQLLYEGVVEQVVFDDKIKVEMLVFRYPPILQWIPHVKVDWQIANAWIVANQAPYELDGSHVRYHVVDCVRNARELFGLDPIWVPQSPQVRKSLMHLLPRSLMSNFDDPCIINVVEWKKTRATWSSKTPVLGRYSRDNLMKFPASVDEMSKAYLAGEKVQVRIMGGQKSVQQLFANEEVPENWELMKYGETPVKDFLETIDFFVYFDNELIVEAFGRSILEAVASGVLVILPERYREVFGEAAIYCTVEQVADVVNKYYKNRDIYNQQVNKALQIIEENFSYESFFNKIVKYNNKAI